MMSETCTVLFKNGMLAAYDENSSAPLFLIIPGPSSRFFIRGNALMHDSKTQTTQEVYRASTPENAAALLQAIQKERLERQARNNKFALKMWAVLLGIICIYIVGNIAISLFSYSENSEKTPSTLSMYQPPVPLSGIPRNTDMPVSTSIPTSTSTSTLTPVPVAPKTLSTLNTLDEPKKLNTSNMPPVTSVTPAYEAPVASLNPENSTDTLAARAGNLKRAADSGRYTISLSSGHSRTIYVFSDPLCPHCQEIEPTLEALTRDYNVVIFPVTLVGKQDTVAAVSPILCSAPLKRAPLWANIFRPGIGLSPATPDTKEPGPGSCAYGENAVAINDRAFDYYQLPGTPQLIADDGRDIPFSALTSDDALARFMNAPEQEVNNGNR
ncbi:thioredoxin fold domain-containing protein [Salmonella enterica]|nr:thioredoxin fold domain-containing protein [Salmonella enterica]